MLAGVSETSVWPVLVALGAVWLVVSSAAAFPSVGQEVTRTGDPSAHRAHGAEGTVQQLLVGNCTGALKRVYMETVALAKDANSLINGTIEVNIDSTAAAFAIDCVRVQPATGYDARALTGRTSLGPNRFTFDIQELPPQRARLIQYEISVYSARPPANAKYHE